MRVWIQVVLWKVTTWLLIGREDDFLEACLRLPDLSFATDKVAFSKFDLVLQAGRGYFGMGAICSTSHNEDSITDC